MTTVDPSKDGPVRHILSLSGGKDSTALAIYLKGRVEDLEYVFCDTGEEMPETYEYLEKLEAYLGVSINRLNPDRPFVHYLKIYNGVLPDARTRWCTRKLKIEPFERFVGDSLCYNYIGIRADEMHRKGYISTKSNIVPRYPFISDGVTRADVFRILEDSGIGLPQYYRWRSRSGCYFCFFQQRVEWVGLFENHPELFIKARDFEKEDEGTGERFTWSARESLSDLIQPERVQQIKQEHLIRQDQKHRARTPINLLDVFSDEDFGESEGESCLICHL